MTLNVFKPITSNKYTLENVKLRGEEKFPSILLIMAGATLHTKVSAFLVQSL